MNPIKTYESFMFEVYLLIKRFKSYENKITEETSVYIPFVSANYWFVDRAERAKDEIKLVYYTGNQNSVKERILNDYKASMQWLRNLEIANPELKKYAPLSSEVILRAHNNPNHPEMRIISLFGTIRTSILNFLGPLVEIVSGTDTLPFIEASGSKTKQLEGGETHTNYNLCDGSIAKLGDVSTPDSEPSTVLGSKDVDRFKKDSSTIPQNDKITILFDSPETLDKLFGAMKPLFPKEREEDFSNLLKGKPLIEKLDFPLNQNQLSDIFRRLYETNRILNSKVQITNWLYQNFTNKGECLGSSIYDNLTKAKYRTSKRKRLYTDIFPPK